MKSEEHRQFAAELLALAQQMDQMVKDYCRQLTVLDDGHWLEQDSSDRDESF